MFPLPSPFPPTQPSFIKPWGPAFWAVGMSKKQKRLGAPEDIFEVPGNKAPPCMSLKKKRLPWLFVGYIGDDELASYAGFSFVAHGATSKIGFGVRGRGGILS